MRDIKTIIKEKGITQKDLAALIGMSEVGLCKALNGDTTLATLEKIAGVLEIPLTDICDVHYAKYSSDKTPLKVGDIELPCYVLENGVRVFSGRGIQKALGNESKSGQWLHSFLNTEGLGAYLRAGDNSITDRLMNPIKFKRNGASGSQSVTNGYEATLFIDLCNAIIDASRAGVYNNALVEFNCDAIVRAVAKVGIIALIDEATGYDKEKDRAKKELQQFLNQFLNEQAAKWVKVFPNRFFEDIYKMHSWTWMNTTKRPGVVGKWINDIVYERIAPLVLEELNKRNPKNINGNRLAKHHQFLTRDIGLPKLKEHLEAIHAIAMLSDYNWQKFMRSLDKAYPKKYQQLEIDFDFDD